MPIVTLTTDFGLDDPFVAAMKAVILGILRDVTFVDISHGVPPQDVVAGALILEGSAPLFPSGTVHLCVVDPGVGSARRAMAVRTARHHYVGPDNGLLTLVLEQDPPIALVQLDNPAIHRKPVSSTFHGRDIFAPAAARLAAGLPLDDLGSPLSTWVQLDLPRPREHAEGWDLHVVHVDRFGNLVLDATAADVARWQTVHAGATPRFMLGTTVIDGVHSTYADVPEAQPVVYVGSGGRLEVAVRNGDAGRALNARVGTTVRMARTA